MKKLRKALKVVIGGGIALAIKKIWDPILDPLMAPVTRFMAKVGLGLAARVRIV